MIGCAVVISVSASYNRCCILSSSSCFVTYLTYGYNTQSLLSIDIYSCRYYPVSLHFTNWLSPLFLLKSLPELQPEPSPML